MHKLDEPSTANADDDDSLTSVADDACLITLQGASPGRRHNLSGEQRVGRDEENHIQVEEKSVSRVHAIIRVERDGVWIFDNGSTNGTYVNDQRVSEVWLRDGDQVRVGNTIFKLLRGRGIDLLYHREVDRLVRHDGLTGLLNLDGIRSCFELACRADPRSPPAMVAVRLDRFEGARNQHARDIVRLGVARALSVHVRASDSVGRTDEDEFLVLLAGFDLPGARRWSGSLALDREGWNFQGHRLRVDVSLGVAMPSVATVEFAEVLRQARMSALCPAPGWQDTRSRESAPFASTPRAGMCELLQSLYNEAELRYLVHTLPDATDLAARLPSNIPLASLALEVVLVLERSGLLAVAFDRIERDRPHRRADIAEVRSRFAGC